MDCKNCGASNPDDATFCKKCGKRTDGMEVCHACGKLTPADGDFCINCGADKNAPPDSVAAQVYPEAGVYGAPIGETAAVAADAEAADDAVAADGGYVFDKYRGLLKKVSSLSACLAALMGIIFVFFIECSLSASYSGESLSVSSGYDIFYFFGDAYDSIDSIISSISSYAERIVTAGTVFGTVCCAAGMAMTIICFLVAAVRLLKKSSGGTEKGIMAPCAATFISFVCTACLFMMCASSNISYYGESVAFTLGGAAIAGIVLGAISLAISVACDVMANIKRARLRQNMDNGVFGVLMAVCGLVVLGVMAKGVISDTLGTYSESCGIYVFFVAIASYAPSTSNTSSTNRDYSEMYSTELALIFALVLAAVIFCIFLIVVLSEIFSGEGEDISSKALNFAVGAGMCAVVCGAMMTAATQVYLDYFDNSLHAALATPIVVIVFGVLLAVVAAAYKKRHKISALKPYLA